MASEKLKYEIEETKRTDYSTTRAVSGTEFVEIRQLKEHADTIKPKLNDFLNGYLDSFKFKCRGVNHGIEISYAGILDTNFTSVSGFETEFENFISSLTE